MRYVISLLEISFQQRGSTALHIFLNNCQRNTPENLYIFEILLENGANPNVPDHVYLFHSSRSIL